jgi:hypothetical protein
LGGYSSGEVGVGVVDMGIFVKVKYEHTIYKKNTIIQNTDADTERIKDNSPPLMPTQH